MQRKLTYGVYTHVINGEDIVEREECWDYLARVHDDVSPARAHIDEEEFRTKRQFAREQRLRKINENEGDLSVLNFTCKLRARNNSIALMWFKKKMNASSM